MDMIHAAYYCDHDRFITWESQEQGYSVSENYVELFDRSAKRPSTCPGPVYATRREVVPDTVCFSATLGVESTFMRRGRPRRQQKSSLSPSCPLLPY